MSLAEWIGLAANIGSVVALALVLVRYRRGAEIGLGVQGLWWAWAVLGSGTWPLYIACTGYTLVYLYGVLQPRK